jgi:hypothetical protein
MVLDIPDPVVGDGHAVRIAAHVVEDIGRSGEGAFGIVWFPCLAD